MELVRINNPFQRQDREVVIIPFNNSTVEDILKEHLEHIKKTHGLIIDYEESKDMIRVSINGLVIPPEFWDSTKPRDKDQIIIMPIVSKGGSEKQILNVVIMIAVVVALGPAGLGVIGVEAGIASNLIGMAIIAGTGMLLQSLTPGPQIKGLNADDWDASNTFSWAPHTTQKQGIVIPKFYGTNKLFGNVIAVHTEIDDSDDTKQNIKMLVALGQGPVEGIVADTIKVNDQNINNFTDIQTEERKGTLNQTAVTFFTETKPEYRPNRTVSNSGGAVIYTTPDSDFDDLEIELLFPIGLAEINNQGGLSNHTIGIKIEISVADAASWSTLVAENIIDNVTAVKRKNYIASVNYTGGSPVTITNGVKYDIRVTKTSDDETSSLFRDSLRIGSVREVIEDDFEYPKTALLGVEALATNQLSGALNVSCIQQGAIVNVFDGADWNLQFSDNPAWVIFDILTQPVITGDDSSGLPYTIDRYEGINPSKMDLVKFFELAVFCDVLVSDGNGGTEKRITFNGGFDIQTTPWEAALKACEIARCMPIWTGSELTLAIDKADDPVQMFNVSDINQDTFKEIFMPQSELVSEIEIHYRDKNQDYKRVPFTILNDSVPNASRRVTLELFGIISQSEAWRAGMHRLAQNQYLKSIVEFEADIDAVDSTIGNVIWVQHDVPEWGQGGRVISGTTLSIIVDKDMTYTQGSVHEVLVRKADDALNTRLTTSQYNTINGGSQGSKEIQIPGDFTDEYKSGDTIRWVDSTGNDDDYTLSIDAVGDSTSTTITTVEVIPSAVFDGGIFNLRRIVVSSVFKDVDNNAEAPAASDIYTFGIQDLHARKYRIINMSKTIDQYIAISAVEYNPLIYDPDGDDPIIALEQGITPPDTTDYVITTPISVGDLSNYIPPSVIGGPNIDIPLTTNLLWTDSGSLAGSGQSIIAWTKEDSVNPILLSFKGITYEIAPASTFKQYIYWNVDSPNEFQFTDFLTDVILPGRRWLMAVNDNGTASPAWGMPIIHAGMLQAGTITAAFGQIGALTVNTIEIIDDATMQHLEVHNTTVVPSPPDFIETAKVDANFLAQITITTTNTAAVVITIGADLERFDSGSSSNVHLVVFEDDIDGNEVGEIEGPVVVPSGEFRASGQIVTLPTAGEHTFAVFAYNPSGDDWRVLGIDLIVEQNKGK